MTWIFLVFMFFNGQPVATITIEAMNAKLCNAIRDEWVKNPEGEGVKTVVGPCKPKTDA